MRTRFSLGRVILVADRGMVLEKVFGEIEKAGLEYDVRVTQARLRIPPESCHPFRSKSTTHSG